ncbi:MAG: hypothetical protein LUD54_05900, partial [Oscillospiraceae bacterium]|nr:hypothetical protein [Oscillospiraceae bacterium]
AITRITESYNKAETENADKENRPPLMGFSPKFSPFHHQISRYGGKSRQDQCYLKISKAK